MDSEQSGGLTARNTRDSLKMIDLMEKAGAGPLTDLDMAKNGLKGKK
jgi:hypothetical protein